MFLLNGKKINIYQDLTIGSGHDAITYPAGSLQNAALRASLGIKEVADPVRPDDRYYWISENVDGSLNAAPKDIVQIKALKSAAIAESRYALETNGIDLDGVSIRTDRESQSMIASALMRVTRNPAAVIDWKGANGWTTIDKAAVELIADAVSNHVQACFTAERLRHEALDALTDFAAVVAFDPTVVLE